MQPLPESLSPIRAYVDRARELKSVSAVVSHQLRVHAAAVGLALRSRDAAGTRWLMGILDELEKERGALGPPEAPAGATLRALAIDIYERARKLDRPDTAPTPRDRWAVLEAPRIAQGLHASAVLLDALTQHGPLSATELAVLRAAHQRSQVPSRRLCRTRSRSSPTLLSLRLSFRRRLSSLLACSLRPLCLPLPPSLPLSLSALSLSPFLFLHTLLSPTGPLRPARQVPLHGAARPSLAAARTHCTAASLAAAARLGAVSRADTGAAARGRSTGTSAGARRR